MEPDPQTAEQTGSAADSAADSSAFDAAAAAAAARAERSRLARLRAHFRVLLDQLIAEYAAPESDHGLEIREVAGGFRFATKPEYHDAVRGFVKTLKPPLKLTLQSLETLAVVAYKQPVTAPEISEIRGVDSSAVLGSLLARKLIATAGRKHVIGRPILYKTTREFLLKFGLKDVSELPSIEEFEKMAGQLAEQEEMPMEHEPSAPPEEPESLPSETENDASDPSAAEAKLWGG
jgi:segregation and condensation protein B